MQIFQAQKIPVFDSYSYATKDFEKTQKEIEKAVKQKFKKTLMGKSIVSSIGEEDLPELNTEAGNILRSDIIDSVYDAGLSDYDDDYEEDDDSPSQRLYGPTLQSLEIKRDYSSSYNSNGQEEIITDDNNFKDTDDDEIESYILSENEAHLIWMRRNGPHLEEMEKKRKERQEEKERKEADPNRKKRPVKQKEPTDAKDHQDAMLQVIKEKKLSTKIIYDVLADIEDGTKD